MDTETYVVDTPGKPTIEKDPNAVLDYPFDWTEYLTPLSDTIISATFILETPLTADEARQELNPEGTIAVVWVEAGGVAGKTYRVTCRIVTADGRIDDRSIWLKMKEL